MNIETAKRGSQSPGRRHLVAFLEGKRLTQRQAIHAKCFECMGGYADGKVDCRISACPLYPYMPYKGLSLVASRVLDSVPAISEPPDHHA